MKARELTLIGCCDRWANTYWSILNIADPMSDEIGSGVKFVEKSVYQALEARHKKLLEALKYYSSENKSKYFIDGTINESIADEVIEADRKASESNK